MSKPTNDNKKDKVADSKANHSQTNNTRDESPLSESEQLSNDPQHFNDDANLSGAASTDQGGTFDTHPNAFRQDVTDKLEEAGKAIASALESVQKYNERV